LLKKQEPIMTQGLKRLNLFALILIFSLHSACADPDQGSSNDISCDEEGSSCPDDMSCVEGVCQSNKESNDGDGEDAGQNQNEDVYNSENDDLNNENSDD